jgi:hypothetical protein
MAINPAFLGHGIFLQLEPINGLRRYAKYRPLPCNPTTPQLVDNFIHAMTDMKMSSVWFELFSRKGILDQDGKQGTKELVDGLKGTKIRGVPWAYCWGTNSQNADAKQNDLYRAISLCDSYKLDRFVADIEPGNEISINKNETLTDHWDPGRLEDLMRGLSTNFGKDNLGISSFASLDDNVQGEARQFLPPVTQYASFCAPQIYWGMDDPVGRAQASLKSWRSAGVTTEMVATVQAYWAKPGKHPTQSEMEGQVRKFLKNYPNTEWSKIIGLNWYHAGWNDNTEEGSMSNQMIKDISAANLDRRPYKIV